MINEAHDNRPKVALTLGDPGGVGPELVARVCHDPQVAAEAALVVVGRQEVLARGAAAAGLPLPSTQLKEAGPAGLPDLGRPSALGGRQAGAFIEQAFEACRAGEATAMATAPISKEALAAAGYVDTGHTTLLARLAGGVRPLMMLAGSSLRVALATIHCPLREVPRRLSTQGIVAAGRLAAQGLTRYWGLAKPRLAVCGLNPHAGEGGLFGREEEEIIAPAVELLKKLEVNASGPHPADTVFWRAASGQFDCVLAMYHDQGLIPLKLLHFEDAVNVTLGLPLIRTSVDHGTAYDLAGTGKANPASLKAAVLLAAAMARRQRGA